MLYPNRFWAAVVPFPALHRSQNGSFWPKAPADDFELRSLRSRWVIFPARFCFGRGSVLEKLGRTHSASACHITVSNASPLLIAFAQGPYDVRKEMTHISVEKIPRRADLYIYCISISSTVPLSPEGMYLFDQTSREEIGSRLSSFLRSFVASLIRRWPARGRASTTR